jgi:hypothetical protein
MAINATTAEQVAGDIGIETVEQMFEAISSG